MVWVGIMIQACQLHTLKFRICLLYLSSSDQPETQASAPKYVVLIFPTTRDGAHNSRQLVEIGVSLVSRRGVSFLCGSRWSALGSSLFRSRVYVLSGACSCAGLRVD